MDLRMGHPAGFSNRKVCSSTHAGMGMDSSVDGVRKTTIARSKGDECFGY